MTRVQYEVLGTSVHGKLESDDFEVIYLFVCLTTSMIVTYWWVLAVVDGGNDGVKTVENWILDSVTYRAQSIKITIPSTPALSFCLFDGVIYDYEVQRSLFFFFFFSFF